MDILKTISSLLLVITVVLHVYIWCFYKKYLRSDDMVQFNKGIKLLIVTLVLIFIGIAIRVIIAVIA